MCGRYTLNQKPQTIAQRYKVAKVPKEIHPNFNVSPTQTMPVITEDQAGQHHLELMKWGIPRTLGKDLVKEIINTRSDKAFGGFWKRTVLNQRCLIPADGFYEWKRTKDGKTPFFIHPKGVNLYSFAGIWDTWKSGDGHEIKTYSIMTTSPNKEMRAIHDRMPVILRPDSEELWLDPGNTDQGLLADMLLPYKDGELEAYEVSRAVNSPRNNNSHLIEAVA
ncbi:MAG: SOS response-associated peptidase [Candidatus Saccharimonadales bacterium]